MRNHLKWVKLNAFKKSKSKAPQYANDISKFTENFEDIVVRNNSFKECIAKFNYNDIKTTSSPIASVKNNGQKSVKKINNIRSKICQKLKQIVNNSPCEFKLNSNEQSNLASDVKLVNFNYKKYCEFQTLTPKTMNLVNNRTRVISTTTTTKYDSKMTYLTRSTKLQTPSNIEYHRRKLNFYNESSMQYDMSEAEPTFNVESSRISTSTPITNKCNCSSMLLRNRISNANTVTRYSNDDSYVSQQPLDESTQLNVESQVLVESTFDLSSCSDMSDEVIILEHRVSQPVSSKKSVKSLAPVTTRKSQGGMNSIIINKYHEDTYATFNELPSWANGNQLNLALVNQIYYNQSARGVFPVNKPEINKLYKL